MDSSSGAIATRIDDITLGPTILNKIGLGGELAAPWGGLGRSLEVCVCVSVCGTWPLLGGTWPLLGGTWPLIGGTWPLISSRSSSSSSSSSRSISSSGSMRAEVEAVVV